MCQSTDQVESGDGVAERGFTPRKASGAGVQADRVPTTWGRSAPSFGRRWTVAGAAGDRDSDVVVGMKRGATEP